MVLTYPRPARDGVAVYIEGLVFGTATPLSVTMGIGAICGQLRSEQRAMNHPTQVQHTVTSSDGTQIAVWESGRGEPLLLVHGAIADHGTTWRKVLPALEAHFSVFAMDRRGRGRSGDGTRYGLEHEASDVAAVVDSLGRGVHVLGHSFGALCALEAARVSARVASLVLYEGVPLRGADSVPADGLEKLDECLAAGDHEGVLVTMLRDVARMSDSDISQLREQREAWATRLGNATTVPRELRAERSYVFRADRFAKLYIPVLVLVGEHSPEHERTHAEMVARSLRRGSLQVLKGQQHIAMHTAPDAFVRVVTEFLLANPA